MRQQTAAIVAAYVGNNSIAASELPALISAVSQSLAGLGQAPVASETTLTPAVPIRRSVSAKTITCLDCGWIGQMLRRHITATHQMTPDDYRARWSLPKTYPMVAKDYAARRSALAKTLGLGVRSGRRRKT